MTANVLNAPDQGTRFSEEIRYPERIQSLENALMKGEIQPEDLTLSLEEDESVLRRAMRSSSGDTKAEMISRVLSELEKGVTLGQLLEAGEPYSSAAETWLRIIRNHFKLKMAAEIERAKKPIDQPVRMTDTTEMIRDHETTFMSQYEHMMQDARGTILANLTDYGQVEYQREDSDLGVHTLTTGLVILTQEPLALIRLSAEKKYEEQIRDYLRSICDNFLIALSQVEVVSAARLEDGKIAEKTYSKLDVNSLLPYLKTTIAKIEVFKDYGFTFEDFRMP